MTSSGVRRGLVIFAVAGMASTMACDDALVAPVVDAGHAAVFDEVWHQFDLHYSYFELKNINWDSLRAYYRPQAMAASGDVAFAFVVSRMLSELRDVHVSLTPTSVMSTLRYQSPAEVSATNFRTDVVFSQYIPEAKTSANGHVRYGMLGASVGYLRIASFEGEGWAAEVDEALDQLRSATQLVIDVRDNAGGTIALAAEIAGRFTDRSRTFGYVRYRNGPAHGDFTGYLDESVSPSGPRQFTGRVYVLTNRRVLSTAEDFVLAMTAIPTTVTVGDTTAGESGGPIVRELPNGWTFQLSEWIEYTSERRPFEGTGLAPTVEVRATAGDASRNVDAALDMVLSLANTAPAGSASWNK